VLNPGIKGEGVEDGERMEERERERQKLEKDKKKRRG
jgi:hypothetical protein